VTLNSPESAAAGLELETRIERRGRAGVIVLDRPRALNALTLSMVRDIARALDEFERDPGVERVVISGAGDRAFSAGGDIRWLYDRGKAGDHEAQLTFWREEYILDRRIKRYGKPYVALIDGLVMGGGVGVSLHGSHHVVSERSIFAMPEVGIGFFPDVGATWLLPRLPNRIGVYLALTGLRANAGDMAALGLATFVPGQSFAELGDGLENDQGPIEAILSRFQTETPPSPLMSQAPLIEAAFAPGDLAAIRGRLETAAGQGSEFAAQALAALAQKSPTSQAIALRQMTLGGDLGFEAAMATEFRIVSRICRGHDFYEGVRAAIVDKDNRPVWRPAPGETIDSNVIDAYFAPLGADELRLPGTAS
jgi:enoyl-CoA hydratase